MTEQRQKLTVPSVRCELGFRFPISDCPNMKMKPDDRSFEYEHYECHRCGHRSKLDYEEMK